MIKTAYKTEKTIVLIGMMGTGKTTIGRMLAQKLNVEFKDADREIEAAAACSVSDIFDLYGETAFRDLEKKVIRRLLQEKNAVIALGGGAFLNEETRKEIKKLGISVWIQTDLPTLIYRTSLRDHRPLLKTGDPEEILRKIHLEREPVYALSDLKVENNQNERSDTVDKIIEKLIESGYLSKYYANY